MLFFSLMRVPIVENRKITEPVSISPSLLYCLINYIVIIHIIIRKGKEEEREKEKERPKIYVCQGEGEART